jgi:hypothetical protein
MPDRKSQPAGSFYLNAIILRNSTKLHHDNRKMQEKKSADRPIRWEVERRAAQKSEIAYLALDRSRARKHRATQ